MTIPGLAEELTSVAMSTYALTGDTQRLALLASVEENTPYALAAIVQNYWAEAIIDSPPDDGHALQAAAARLADGGSLGEVAVVFGPAAKALAALDIEEADVRAVLATYINSPASNVPDDERGAIHYLRELLAHDRQCVAWARVASQLSGRPGVSEALIRIANQAGLSGDTATIAAVRDSLPAWLAAAGKDPALMDVFLDALVPHLPAIDRVELSLSRRASFALAQLCNGVALARAAILADEPAAVTLPAMCRDGEPLTVTPPEPPPADVSEPADSEVSVAS